jgi:hypothetical protein
MPGGQWIIWSLQNLGPGGSPPAPTIYAGTFYVQLQNTWSSPVSGGVAFFPIQLENTWYCTSEEVPANP